MTVILPSTVPKEKTPECVACKRQPSVDGPKMTMGRMSDGTMALTCVNPSECKRHWPAEDRKGH